MAAYLIVHGELENVLKNRVRVGHAAQHGRALAYHVQGPGLDPQQHTHTHTHAHTHTGKIKSRVSTD
jgi:hypothetical protein